MFILIILLSSFISKSTLLAVCCVQYLAASGKDLDSANDTKQLEADLLKSELWTTVFRGGYVVKQLERSFSGRHVC